MARITKILSDPLLYIPIFDSVGTMKMKEQLC
jgi:hypothetical protein